MTSTLDLLYDMLFTVSVVWASFGCKARMSLLTLLRRSISKGLFYRITCGIVLIIMFALTFLYGIPLALTPLLLVIIGFTISFMDEKSRRAEFFLQFYPQEIINHLSNPNSNPPLVSFTPPTSTKTISVEESNNDSKFDTTDNSNSPLPTHKNLDLVSEG